MPFSQWRILDLTSEPAYLCGRLLADLGANVVKVEPPGGDPERYKGPFYMDKVDPEYSLAWWAYNLNKRGITLSLESAEGRELFRQLLPHADAVIESFPPGYLASLGLGYEDMAKVRPDIVLTSVTPFGQTGPYAEYLGPDLVVMAMGGLLALTGDEDRPPVRISVPQAGLHAAADAAIGTALALYHRDGTGIGQHVDVSMQESVTWTLFNVVPAWDLEQRAYQRSGSWRQLAGSNRRVRLIWPCSDGHVAYQFGGGPVFGPSTNAMVAWMAEEGKAPDFLLVTDFASLDFNLLSQEEIDLYIEALAGFIREHNKADLFEQAVQRRILLQAVATVSDLWANEQLQSRGFFQPLHHSELGKTVMYPGAFAKFSQAAVELRRRAPLIGEHNREIYVEELGISPERFQLMQANGAI